MGGNVKILIIDNLTETFNGALVKSGLQRSSKLDAQGVSKLGYDTTYIFCGNIDDTYQYKKISVDDYGAKERAVVEGKSPKQSSMYIKQYLNRISKELNSTDYIIAHCHSSASKRRPCKNHDYRLPQCPQRGQRLKCDANCRRSCRC